MAYYGAAIELARARDVAPSGEDLSKMPKLAHVGWDLIFWGIIGVLISLGCLAIGIIVFLIALAISLILIFVGVILLIINKKRNIPKKTSS